MSDFYSYEAVPTWRFVMYGVLAAVGVAALGYFEHSPSLHIFAGICGVVIGGFGFVLRGPRAHSKPVDGRYPKGGYWTQMNAVKLIRFLAFPAALMGCLIFYDIFLAPPQQDVAKITFKYITHGKGGGNYIEARGHSLYRKSVPLSFWSRCNSGDEIELALTPRFKQWRHVSLVKNGKLVAESMGRDIFWLGLFGACFFVPCIFFLPSISETLPGLSSRQENKFRVFCLVVETLALGIWAAILLGYSGW